jgi:serine/threonine protein kinase
VLSCILLLLPPSLYVYIYAQQLLGTPTEEVWPGVTSLPDWNEVFPTWPKLSLRHTSPGLCDDGLDLLEKLLTYDPAYRISAKRALEHPYFANFDSDSSV